MAAVDYYPFGETVRSYYNGGDNTRYMITEKERDWESEYDNFGGRYYNSEICRWMSFDPLEILSPGQSPYAYCNNNPMVYIDPSGLSGETPSKGKGPEEKIKDKDGYILTWDEMCGSYMVTGIREQTERVAIENQDNPEKKTVSFDDFSNHFAFARGGYNSFLDIAGPSFDFTRTMLCNDNTCRYVTDPLNPGESIDMLHFLVAGQYGQTIGMIKELSQIVYAKNSAMDHQDLYSNRLGEKFWFFYGEKVAMHPEAIFDYMKEFLNSPEQRDYIIQYNKWR